MILFAGELVNEFLSKFAFLKIYGKYPQNVSFDRFTDNWKNAKRRENHQIDKKCSEARNLCDKNNRIRIEKVGKSESGSRL